MSLRFSSLNSGSNGNCYYIGNSSEAVLIDAGLSCRETLRRMERSGLDIGLVRAIFISHEHSDHISGVETLSSRFGIPVYITRETLRHSGLKIKPVLVRSFLHNDSIAVGALRVKAFRKLHDGADPHSFTVSDKKHTVGVFTDLGRVCDELASNFAQCHAAFLEANYDVKMLAEGGYPLRLQRRISGGHGHLSNLQALEVFLRHRSRRLSVVLLSHLSRNNNKPEIVMELFRRHAGGVNIQVASRDNESEVFSLGESFPVRTKKSGATYQLSLFEAVDTLSNPIFDRTT